MKLLHRTLLVFALIALVSSLHLSKQTENDFPRLMEPDHLRSYYGKHYRAHRSAEYVHRITADNLKMINDFNNKNQNVLRAAGPGATVSGGNSFAMEPNKFIEFSEDEFLELFTGARPPAKGKHHELEESQQNHQTEQSHDAGWVFENPYKINDHELDLLYGSVNDDSNYGWDWESFDSDYYNDFSSDYDHYWDDWENDHWDANKKGQDTWWSGWYSDQEKNKNNANWWNTDPWSNNNKSTNNKTTPASNNKTTPASNNKTNVVPKRTIPEYAKTAVEVNWNLKKATTHIKQQGECGSCWSFTSIGVVESYLIIMGLGTMDLSEQQLVDCQTSGSYGCDGGWPKNSLDWVAKNGLVAEDKYPYLGVQKKCIHTTGPHKIPSASQISGRVNIENALRKGPIGGALHADNGFQFYSKGIFDKCLSSQVNHAIVIVGFTKDYWIIRNSWGADWGEDGHIRIKKDQNNKNACSIESYGFAVNY